LAERYVEKYQEDLSAFLDEHCEIDGIKYWWKKLRFIPQIKVICNNSTPRHSVLQVRLETTPEIKPVRSSKELESRILVMLELYSEYCTDIELCRIYRKVYLEDLDALVKSYGCNDLGDYIMCHLTEQVVADYVTKGHATATERQIMLFCLRSTLDNQSLKEKEDTKVDIIDVATTQQHNHNSGIFHFANGHNMRENKCYWFYFQ